MHTHFLSDTHLLKLSLDSAGSGMRVSAIRNFFFDLIFFFDSIKPIETPSRVLQIVCGFVKRYLGYSILVLLAKFTLGGVWNFLENQHLKVTQCPNDSMIVL